MPKPDPTTHSSIQRPELLAPAGDWECARAAVENGADAIYFGLERFNARMRAHNFTVADLPELMEFLHRRGVRGYVTFNTLIFETEIEAAADYLSSIISAGVDAAIVQDIGICRLIRNLSPDFPIHGSTQMTVTSSTGVSFARKVGCDLVVLARECSIKDLNTIRTQQIAAATETESALPLEVFVHGALCVAYSGQCLTSEVLGGRSANRGECAQACRMPYELISDGQKVELGDRQYLLSPQDLAGIEVLPDLIQSGVSSLKIEGRLKAPEYVASITRVYREAIDSVCGKIAKRSPVEIQPLLESSRYDLEMSFSRGLYTGWFKGNNNQELAHARFGKKRGVHVGDVTQIGNGRVQIRQTAPLEAGDGVVFDHGNPEIKEEGGRVYHVDTINQAGAKKSVISFGHDTVDFSRVHVGDLVWKTSDPKFEKRVRKTFDGEKPKFQRPVTVKIRGRIGESLTMVVRDGEGNTVNCESDIALEAAHKSPLTTERLTQQLGRLGGTPFRLDSIDNQLEGEVILPVSELNRLRRDAIDQLDKLRTVPKRWTLNSASVPFTKPTQSGPPRKSAQLSVLIRSLDQLEPVLASDITTVYCDFENPKRYRDAVAKTREFNNESQSKPSVEIFVAPPRIFKMGEEWILEQVASSDPDGFLVRNYDHLEFFKSSRKIGDFSLNITNSITADYFKNAFQLERLTASYDLNTEQLEALLTGASADWFEVTLHQHMPMFHMEHCVFCAFLSEGKDYRDCGRPCDKHSVQLRDRVGMEHPLKADVGCRNTLFNGRAQTGAEFYDQLFESGARHFRIEFVNESAKEIETTLAMYQSLMRDELTGSDLWKQLKLQSQLGVTRGQMGKQ